MTTTQPGMQQKRDTKVYFLHLLRTWLLFSHKRGGQWPEGLVLARVWGASSRVADRAAGDRFTHLPHKSRTLYLLRDCLRSVEEFRIPANLSWFIIVNFPTVALLRPVHWGSQTLFSRPEPITLLDSLHQPIGVLVSKPQPIRKLVDNSKGRGRANARHAFTSPHTITNIALSSKTSHSSISIMLNEYN